mgnify:CR=1 FL=1
MTKIWSLCTYFICQRNVKIKSDLMRTLRAAGCEDVILKGRNRLSVDTERFDCDYYHFLNGEPSAVSAFVGEFMTQYSWAEITPASLLGMITKYSIKILLMSAKCRGFL